MTTDDRYLKEKVTQKFNFGRFAAFKKLQASMLGQSK